ncbi:MAG: hypothetical protein ACTSRU_21330, partial [Candidatus Hodarchaeales archaeon]
PDPLANKYIAFASILSAALDGIERELEPPDPVKINLFNLDSKGREKMGIDEIPKLKEGLKYLEKDRVLRETLGNAFLSSFLKIKDKELELYENSVNSMDFELYSTFFKV